MRIETVELHASDLTSLQRFYGERLGLKTKLERSRLEISIGESQLIFRTERNFSGRYHFAINIPENRLDSAIEFLQRKQVGLLSDANDQAIYHFESWDAHAVYFHDPQGNIVEFIARHGLSNNSLRDYAAPFSPLELLCISEIGLAVDDVLKSAAELSKRLGMEPYREGSSDFMPLGDAKGLLILVPKGRLWFPNTGVPAEALPMRAHLRVDGHQASCFLEINSGGLSFEG